MFRRRLVWGALTGIGLLASTATVYAECAWLQWSNLISPSGENAWSVVAAYTQHEGGKAACEKSVASEKKRAQADQGVMKGVPVRMCLPDSVDPRGKQGK
jgi:hypothetical protein